ncbi:hypothetical protein BWQ96_00043 [Gracilariopsis chorda]|uniref:Uncharacterized protein n=1 Tax=Gracilariopsis chorda TaxID=448386 RepID=A0A2V3J6E3_9FLOR|nr:hypothetical protein BWQ96_00043 [Gracilariopsis chorda]|eukprot:PXF49883.1 hypothetical protein BWQ96_00043 [Gracilariopsis chorda]
MENNVDTTTFILFSRSWCLVFQTDGVFYVDIIDLEHGESETRLVGVMNKYVILAVQSTPHMNSHGLVTKPQSAHRIDLAYGWMNGLSQTIIISDETDVFLTLLRNPVMSE